MRDIRVFGQLLARATVGVALLLGGFFWIGSAQAASVVGLTTAVRIDMNVRRPEELDISGGETLALPDNWSRTRPGHTGSAWYVIPLDKPLLQLTVPPGTPLALMVPRLAHEGEVWLNDDRLIPSDGAVHTRNRTLWYSISPSSWRTSGNMLQVRVTGVAHTRSGLSAMSLGEAAALRPAYLARWVPQTLVSQVLAISAALAFFVVLPLWWKRRERVQALFLVFCLLWFPRGLIVFSTATAPPMPMALALLSAMGILQSIVVAELVVATWPNFTWWRRFRQWMYGVAILTLTGTVLFAQSGSFRPVSLVAAQVPLIILLLVPLMVTVRAALLIPRASHVSLALALSAWWCTALHDLAQAIDLTSYDSFFWTPNAILVVLAIFAWRAVAGLAQSRTESEAATRAAVSHAVVAQEAHLRTAFAAQTEVLKAQVREEVIAAERTRLLHDLHDGMGSQLITALRMTRRPEVPREEVARVIEDALDDMRLIIDSLDLEERDLLPLLGNLRFRLEPRLTTLGVALHWDVQALPDLDYLTPESGLAIVRIVQEAITNALRHGEAHNITIGTRHESEFVSVSVLDDGCGFDVEHSIAPQARPRGLAAMRARALKLNAELHIESRRRLEPGETNPPCGTCITLILPLRLPVAI